MEKNSQPAQPVQGQTQEGGAKPQDKTAGLREVLEGEINRGDKSGEHHTRGGVARFLTDMQYHGRSQ